MNHVKEMMCEGECSDLTSAQESLILSFIEEIGVKWSIERQIRGAIGGEDEETAYIGDEYDEESEEDCGEDAIVGDVGIEKFWTPKLISRKNFCSSWCRNDCQKVTEAWGAEKIKKVTEIFKSDKVVSVKNKLISHLEVQENIGVASDSYVVLGHQFCMEFLSHMAKCSLYILKTVLEDYCRGVRCYDHGNKGIVKSPSVATMNFIVWFKNFLNLYGQDAPDDQVVILNHWLKGKVSFNMYVEEAPHPHISLTTFYAHLKTYFGPKRVDKSLPCHRISAYSSHSVCDLCVALNAHRKLSKTQAELSLANALFNQHKMDFGMARRSVEEVRQNAIDFPHDVLFIQCDGMDNRQGVTSHLDLIVFTSLCNRNYIVL